MLSKAEIWYLQGEKTVSKSYERKLECLIKKKIDVFIKEIPLLSKLILNNSGISDDMMYQIKEVDLLNNFDKQNSNKELCRQSINNQDTEFSNDDSRIIESDSKKILTCDDLGGFEGSINSQIAYEGATKFSNSKSNDIEIDSRGGHKKSGLWRIYHLNKDNSIPATELVISWPKTLRKILVLKKFIILD